MTRLIALPEWALLAIAPFALFGAFMVSLFLYQFIAYLLAERRR